MQVNILAKSKVVKLIIKYTDGNGINRKDFVEAHYSDKKNLYFLCEYPEGFKKPRWRARAEITVFTTDGVYKTTEIIRDAYPSNEKLMIEIDLPKTWDFKQLRAGIRRNVEIPIKITFADDFILDATIEEVSVSGFQITSNHQLTTVQMGFVAKCKFNLSENEVFNTDIKYVRQIKVKDEYDKDLYKYSFKFAGLSTEMSKILKTYLIQHHNIY